MFTHIDESFDKQYYKLLRKTEQDLQSFLLILTREERVITAHFGQTPTDTFVALDALKKTLSAIDVVSSEAFETLLKELPHEKGVAAKVYLKHKLSSLQPKLQALCTDLEHDLAVVRERTGLTNGSTQLIDSLHRALQDIVLLNETLR